MRKEDTNIQIMNDQVFNKFLIEYFNYDPKHNRLTTKLEKLKEFYDLLPGDPLTLTVNGDDAKGEFGAHFNFIFQKASAYVTGRLLDEAGYTLTNLCDRQVIIRGLKNGIRQMYTVDVHDEFIFPLLLADEYSLFGRF